MTTPNGERIISVFIRDQQAANIRDGKMDVKKGSRDTASKECFVMRQLRRFLQWVVLGEDYKPFRTSGRVPRAIVPLAAFDPNRADERFPVTLIP